MKQILLNLLNNAIKFTNSGNVELKVDFEVSKEMKEVGIINFSVKDTGIGISEENQRKLFKTFSQADSSVTRKYGGTGLGLRISSLIAEKMNTAISIQSELGNGSAFSFAISTKYRHGDQLNIKDRKEHEIEIIDGPLNILVAEDNEINLILIRRLLNKIIPNSQITEAKDGKEAVLAATKFKYDLILMDIQMPNMDGITASLEIRKVETILSSNAPIVALTANANEEERKRCLQAGMNEFLTKPIDLKRLRSVLKEFLTK